MERFAELIQQAHEGDKSARNELVSENLGLVRAVARRFDNRGHDRDELFQIGCIGLMKAIDKFDISLNLAFSTYAVPMITGEIRRFLRDDGMVKVSRSMKESSWRVKKSREKLEQKLGRSVTLQELAEDTGLSEEEIALALDASEEVSSIYQTIYQSDGSELYLVDKMADDDPEEEQMLNRVTVQQLMDMLEPKEQQLIRLRYFDGKTQSVVADVMGMTQVQVSRMEKKVLRKMRMMCEKS